MLFARCWLRLLCGFLLLLGGGLEGCSRRGLGFRRAGHYGFRMPEIGSNLCDVVRRIAEVRREAIERGVGGFNGVGVHLQEFLVAFIAENVVNRWIVVEAAQGRA